jgi:hypothetical protein
MYWIGTPPSLLPPLKLRLWNARKTLSPAAEIQARSRPFLVFVLDKKFEGNFRANFIGPPKRNWNRQTANLIYREIKFRRHILTIITKFLPENGTAEYISGGPEASHYFPQETARPKNDLGILGASQTNGLAFELQDLFLIQPTDHPSPNRGPYDLPVGPQAKKLRHFTPQIRILVPERILG